MEQNSKSGLGGHEVGLPTWPIPPKGDQIRESRCPIHEFWAGTVKGKGRTSEGKGRRNKVKDNDKQGQ